MTHINPTVEMMEAAISRYTYNPYSNRFGYQVTGDTLEARYQDLQRQLAETARKAAETKAKMIAKMEAMYN